MTSANRLNRQVQVQQYGSSEKTIWSEMQTLMKNKEKVLYRRTNESVTQVMQLTNQMQIKNGSETPN